MPGNATLQIPTDVLARFDPLGNATHTALPFDVLGEDVLITGPHPGVPLLVGDTAKTHRLVQHLLDQGVLMVGLTFSVVPRGDETLRFQINAAHTRTDIDEGLKILSAFKE